MNDPKTSTAAGPFDQLPTREGYNRWAEIYDTEDNPLIVLEEPRVRELLGDVRGLRVADIGCGTGRHALRLAAEGAVVTAVDFSEGMMEKARAKPGADRIRWLHHDIGQPLPLGDGEFDRVLCALVLDHVQDLEAFFRELIRICRPEGVVVISSFHPAMMLRGVQARFVDPTTGRDTRPASFANSISDYVTGAVRAGLTIEHMSEHAVDEAFAARSARAAKYLNWPMLLMMRLHRSPSRDRVVRPPSGTAWEKKDAH
ncbi:MAG TPA: class I SAM-dependent methyltransferase [Phycisphaerae bacterium]|nr:class I SAM-dependent methyltransferase [Phycisphaerae bacterium]